MKLNRAVGLRICNIMINRKIPSQYAVCKEAGLTESTLRNIINENHKSLRIDTLIRVCDGLGITLQEFLNDDLFKRENLDIE